LRFFWFARHQGFNNGFNRSGQGGARYLFHEFSLFAVCNLRWIQNRV
jgi:hypothetical protein